MEGPLGGVHRATALINRYINIMTIQYKFTRGVWIWQLRPVWGYGYEKN